MTVPARPGLADRSRPPAPAAPASSLSALVRAAPARAAPSGKAFARKAANPAAAILAVLLAAVLAAAPLAAQGAAQNGAPGAPGAGPSLAPDPEDPPEVVRLKAAMRLIAAYGQVEQLCKLCGLAGTFSGYSKANGRAVAQAIAVLKEAAALTPEWKAAVQRATGDGVAEASAANACAELDGQIRRGDWALHGGRFEDDYQLMRGR